MMKGVGRRDTNAEEGQCMHRGVEYAVMLQIFGHLDS